MDVVRWEDVAFFAALGLACVAATYYWLWSRG